MADYKVVFRADDSTSGDAALLWEYSCPAMLTAVQVSRNIQTSDAYLQVKIRNVSHESLDSVRGQATIGYSDGSTEQVDFDDLDVDLAPNGQKALKAVPLPRGDVEFTTIRITQVAQASGRWESSTAPAAIPSRTSLTLSDKAAAERRRRLEAANIDARTYGHSVQDHGDWWVCACGQANVKSDVCCECGSSKSALQSAEDELALLSSADEWSESTYQKAIELANDKASIASLSQALELFGQVRGWKDSADRISSCESQIEKLRTASARRTKKIVGAAAAVAIVAIVAVLVVVNVVIPDGKYNDALSLAESGQYAEAVAILEDLGGYRDSDTKIDEFVQVELDSGQACLAVAKEVYYDDKEGEFLAITYSYDDGALVERDCKYNPDSSSYDSQYCKDSHDSYTCDKSGAPTKRSGDGNSNSYTETIDQVDEWGQPTKVSRKLSDGKSNSISLEYYGQAKLKSYAMSYDGSDGTYRTSFNEDGTASVSTDSLSESTYSYTYNTDGSIKAYTHTNVYRFSTGDDTDTSRISVEYNDHGKIGTEYEDGKLYRTYEYAVVHNPKPWLVAKAEISVPGSYLLLE